MNIKSILLLTTLFNLMTISHVSAEKYMYKWANSSGETQYTERPPAVGIKFERMQVKDEGIGKQNIPLKSKADTAQEKASEKDDKYGGWRKDNCKKALQNLDVLQNAGRITTEDGQGGKRLMSDEERAAQIEEMKALEAKYCSEEK